MGQKFLRKSHPKAQASKESRQQKSQESLVKIPPRPLSSPSPVAVTFRLSWEEMGDTGEEFGKLFWLELATFGRRFVHKYK